MIERVMSLLNFGLYGAVFTRPILKNNEGIDDTKLEHDFTSCNGQEAIREKVSRQPDLKKAVEGALKASCEAVEDRFKRKTTLKGEPIRIAPQCTEEEILSFVEGLRKIHVALPNLIRTSPKGLSDPAILPYIQSFVDSDHCKRRTYIIQFRKECWTKAAKAALDKGENPDDLPDNACNTCPFQCSRPNIPLSIFATIPDIPSPMPSLVNSEDSDYLSLEEALTHISNGTRIDEEHLPPPEKSDKNRTWKVPPTGKNGQELKKSAILCLDKIRCLLRCYFCGKSRIVCTPSRPQNKNDVNLLREFIVEHAADTYKCGDDLTEDAKNFGLHTMYIPYTRLTSNSTRFQCSHLLEELVYKFQEGQDLCYVCGTNGVQKSAEDSNKPLCPPCREKGWKDCKFQEEKNDKVTDAANKKGAKRDFLTLFGTQCQQGQAETQPPAQNLPSVPSTQVLPDPLIKDFRNVVGATNFLHIKVHPHVKDHQLKTIIQTLKGLTTAQARKEFLETQQIFELSISPTLAGTYNDILPDGFCYFCTDVCAYFNKRTLKLNQPDDRALFKKYYQEIWPEKMGERLNDALVEERVNEDGSKFETVKSYIQAVISCLDSYPKGKCTSFPLPERLWGGTSQFMLQYSSALLEVNQEGVLPHIAYWNKKDRNEFMHLNYLIGPSAQISGDGTSKHFTSCLKFSFQEMRAGFSIQHSDDSINNILNFTFDGSHYYHTSSQVTTGFMTDNLMDGWNQYTTEINNAIDSTTPTQPILSVVVGTRGGQTRVSTMAAGKLATLCFSVDNSSASRADFSQQSFSHLKCNAPFEKIIYEHGRLARTAYQTMTSSKRAKSQKDQTQQRLPFLGIIDTFQTSSTSKSPSS